MRLVFEPAVVSGAELLYFEEDVLKSLLEAGIVSTEVR